MLKQTRLLATVGLSASFLWCGRSMAAEAGAVAAVPSAAMVNDTAMITLPAGITGTELKDKKGLQNAMSAVAESVFSRSSFADVVGRAVDQDRERLNQYKLEDKKDMNEVVAKLDKAWKDKYGSAFSIDVSKAYPDNFASIMEGEVSDTTQLVGRWPLAPIVGEDRGNNNPPKGQLNATDANRIKDTTFGGDVNLEKGRRVGVITIPASQGLPAITCSMIYENPMTWRFDLPNTISGAQLHDNLVALQQHLLDNQAKWPADVNDAYRYVTHATLATMVGVDVTKVVNTPAMAGKDGK